MKRKRQHRKGMLREMLPTLYRIPQGLTFSEPTIHINCYGQIRLENCRKILLYNQDEIVIQLDRLAVSIRGDGLVMDTLSKEAITVSGTCLLYTSSVGGAAKEQRVTVFAPLLCGRCLWRLSRHRGRRPGRGGDPGAGCAGVCGGAGGKLAECATGKPGYRRRAAGGVPVSYTHLDVYKRQVVSRRISDKDVQ